jgi:transketolase
MRKAFVETLTELADSDPRIVLLTGDLGYMAIESFAEKHPDRFINVGVAEQNMVGVATGLAESGYIPFTYSIVPFSVLRPYEFIRNGPIHHGLPVRIVGVGGGVEYGTNGVSHYGLEDVAVMRAQPEMQVIAPADHEQARQALTETWNNPGPIYYRLGKDDRTTVPGLSGRFEQGKVQRIGEGEDILVVAMGNVANEAVAAKEILASQGVDATVAVVASVHPAPAQDLADLLGSFRAVVSVEAHYLTGGLGSLLSEIIAEHGLHCRLVRRGIGSVRNGITGSQAYLYEQHGLSPQCLADAALAAISKTR